MVKEKITKRQLQAIETKKKLYETAKKLFLSQGLENVSVDSIIKGAGVSKGTFYVHFESKDALTTLLIDDYVNEIDMDYTAYLETISDETSVFDILLFFTGEMAEVLANRIGYENMRSLYKSHITNTSAIPYTMSYSRELYKIFGRVLERGINQGEFRSDLPVDTLANNLVLAIRGITFEWCIRYPNFDLKEQCLLHMDILLKGILGRQ